jgi:hypothetical protein
MGEGHQLCWVGREGGGISNSMWGGPWGWSMAAGKG